MSEGEFVFGERVWFLVQKVPPNAGPDERVLAGLFQDAATGKSPSGVYAFSDDDLAATWIEKRNPPVTLDVIAPPDDAALIDFLERLERHGHRNLGVDAETASHLLIPIAAVVEQIRRRAGG